jgi:hypothetical protein
MFVVISALVRAAGFFFGQRKLVAAGTASSQRMRSSRAWAAGRQPTDSAAGQAGTSKVSAPVRV